MKVKCIGYVCGCLIGLPPPTHTSRASARAAPPHLEESSQWALGVLRRSPKGMFDKIRCRYIEGNMTTAEHPITRSELRKELEHYGTWPSLKPGGWWGMMAAIVAAWAVVIQGLELRPVTLPRPHAFYPPEADLQQAPASADLRQHERPLPEDGFRLGGRNDGGPPKPPSAARGP